MQPPREAALEVAGDPESREDPGEAPRTGEARTRTGRRCSRRGSRTPACAGVPDRPPAKAVKKKSGKATDGISSDLLWKKLCSIRQATPCATASLLTRRRASVRSAQAARATATAAIVAAIDERERERLPVPADDDQAAHALDQVRDRVHRRGILEPGDAHQVPRDRHRRDEEEDEEHREEALHRLSRPGAERREHPERTEGQRDEHIQHEQHEDAGEHRSRTGLRPRSRRPGTRPPGTARAPRCRRAGPRAGRPRASASARAGSGTRSGCRGRDRCRCSSSRTAHPG